MKYNSVPEYFVKLYNRLYALVLIPLVVFSFLFGYVNLVHSKPVLEDETLRSMVAIVFIAMAVIDWLTSIFLYKRGVKKILTIGSLGERLDRLCTLTLMRVALVTLGLLALTAGFYLTQSSYLIIAFGATLATLVLAWPTSVKVCNDLDLKGDERRLILYKLDRLS